MSRALILPHLMLLLFGLPAGAAELLSSGQNIQDFGRGGVRFFSGYEARVLQWNPAGLGHMKGIRWDLLNLDLGVNGQSAYDLFESVSDAQGLSDLAGAYGKPIWIGGSGHTSLAIPYFGLSYYDELYTEIYLNNPPLPEMKLKYYNDMILAMGFAFRTGPLSAGLGLRQITRSGGNQVLGADQLTNFDGSTLTNGLNSQGIGYGVDLGLMYKPDTLLNPTLHWSWQNVGDTTFVKTRGTAAPDSIQDNMTVGASMGWDSLLAGFTVGLEYRHIQTTGEQIGKKLHMGAEVSLLNMDFRGGFYQGYTTYGFGLDLFILQLEAALYTVEKGAYPGQTPDQRFQIGISSSFGFDPDFKLTDSGGKKRRLKQRR